MGRRELFPVINCTDIAGMPAFYESGETPLPASGHAVDICVYVSDLAGVVAHAEALGAPVPLPPQVMPWGETVAYVQDPREPCCSSSRAIDFRIPRPGWSPVLAVEQDRFAGPQLLRAEWVQVLDVVGGHAEARGDLLDEIVRRHRIGDDFTVH